LKLADVNKAVEAFKYNDLFLELGWEIPSTNSFAIPSSETDDFPSFSSKVIARLQSVSVYEVCLEDSDEVPSKKLRHRVAARISETSRENITIFVNKSRSKTVWCWFAKGKTNSTNLREHAYLKGQPGDLFASKILNLYFDFADFDSDGNVALAEVTSRLQTAMDVERVTKKFFNAFTEERLKFVEHISGIDDEKDKAWYASTLLNRLMFIWFLQAKHFLGKPDIKYLENKLSGYDSKKSDYFSTFLQALFFEGFAKKEKDRSANARKLVGEIPYLNGGLFLKNRVELTYPDIKIKNEAFENLFALFGQYSWNLDDTPGGKANEMNPDVLGYIFEKYINQKGFGAYYTPPDITTLLDPACGSGAFLVAAMKVLHGTYGAIIGHIQANNYSKLNTLLDQFQEGHATLAYAIKKAIITNNLFGVDIMAEGAEIAKLRLFMTLVATAKTVDQLEPLPNIDFNILSGNSLIGLLSVDYEEFTEHQPMDMFHNDSLTQLMEIKNRNIDAYKAAGQPMEVLEALRDGIREARTEAYETMDRILVEKMGDKKIKYKEITWDIVNNKANKAKLRALTKSDISAEEPFHWGYDFDEVMVRGGFDAIITNPPWDTFQKDEKEFFQEYDGNIGKIKIQVSDLHLTAPWWLNVIELNSKTDKEICKKLYSQPLLQNSSERNQSIAFSQELNMSTNRNIFTTSENASSIPLYSGGVIWHFDNDFGDLKFWVNKKKGRNKILGRTKDVGQRLSSDSYRLGFRDIASSTNERSLISTIIPPAFNGHKLPTLIVVDENGADIFSKNDQLLLTSFFNSFVLDWVLRNKINASVSFFYVLQLPVPPFAEQSWCKEISSRASKLICTSPEYDELAKAVGLNDHTSGVTDATKRQAIRAEIDAIIAHIYGLTEDEFTHILKTFPIVDQSVKDDTLAAFRRSDLKALVAPSATTTLLSPLAKLLASDDDEGDNAEFKSTFEWCIRQGKKDKGLQKSVLKTIAAFLNSSGGMLAIGVEDDKSIYGLDADYALLSKPDKREWFEQKLVTAITNSIGAEFTNCYTAAYEVHEGKDVMVVTVHERGPVPAYLDIGQDSEFYVRTGRKTIALTARDMGKYISTHW